MMSIGTGIRMVASVSAILVPCLTSSVLASTADLTRCTTSSFTVTAAVQTSNGHTTYTYTMTKAPKKGKNLFFIYTTPGLGSAITGKVNGWPGGQPIANGFATSQLPAQSTWKLNKHNDGFLFAGIAKADQLQLKVSERSDPTEARSTIILGPASSYAYYGDDHHGDDHHDDKNFEVCGPILGPTTPASTSGFANNPVALTVVEQTFANGCTYRISSDPVSNVITAMVDATPPGTPTDDNCSIIIHTDCAAETGLVFCPPGRIGQPPLQTEPGGLCYYGDIKFFC